MILENQVITITGGTGSLGQKLLENILTGKYGIPKKIIVFSRDELKQHNMRLAYKNLNKSTDEIIYDGNSFLEFQIGDIRNEDSVLKAIRNSDIVINAAALKQVPTCEYFVDEAIKTNIGGPLNIVNVIQKHKLPVKTVIGVITDKAVKPINVMGMTKAIQEKIFISANLLSDTRFVCVRYGNVIASRGSVIPLFLDQVEANKDLTITTPDMTRFLLPLELGVETIMMALSQGDRGETFIPIVKSAKITDIANSIIEEKNKKIKIKITGIRPGEKIHEVLVSESECYRTFSFKGFYVIGPHLPELQKKKITDCLQKEYSSENYLMTYDEVKLYLKKYRII